MAESNSELIGSIAVIGLACRFPGAEDERAFWKLLVEGREGITHFSEEELAHVGEEILERPDYVRALGAFEDTELFDAALFGLSPNEAAVTDPQQRLFLECGWRALEDAGLGHAPGETAVGVFAGASTTAYRGLLEQDAALVEAMGVLQVTVGNDKDHLAPRLSYLLDLKGPSVPVQTACSTSLVAVHLACQSLLQFESDVALAGGASVHTPARGGYLYQEGGILSPDGHCRAFAAQAAGTVPASGVGLVVLKRLEDALEDGDRIRAVIRGSAINNDGAAKVGYTAPGVDGQRRVIEEAQEVAGVHPDEISYVEAHGTGTLLGDPIEVEALTQAFRADGALPPVGSCALGSVKSNIGHADAAAGVAGLIKTILCLEHRTLVPSLHCDEPNPAIPFATGPFSVNTETRPWEAEHLLAGVSSFGIGGTNAHVLVEEAPAPEPEAPATRRVYPMALSAGSEAALTRLRQELAEALDPETGEPPALHRTSRTLALGRRHLTWRWSTPAADLAELREALTEGRPGTSLDGEVSPSVVFVFPGQGSDLPSLGLDLYSIEPVFTEAVDACAEGLRSHLEGDLGERFRDLLLDPDSRDRLAEADLWQPALFTVQYALAQLWRSWGIEPEAMIGHSLGEITAAHLAGVLSLDDALALVAARGRGVRSLEEGAMIALAVDEDTARGWIRGNIDLAAVNDAGLSVLSGPVAEIDALAEELAAKKPIRLATDRAFHSPMMDGLLSEIETLTQGFERRAPQIPLISNLTGTWLTPEDATSDDYWARHLRGTVRFQHGLDTLAERGGRILLEVGPGRVLTRLARRQAKGRYRAFASFGEAVKKGEAPPSDRQLASALGHLWRAGAVVPWERFFGDERPQPAILPGVPFERRSHWCAGADTTPDPPSLTVRLPVEKWLHTPIWREVPPLPPADLEDSGPWLLFADGGGLADALARRLEEAGVEVIRVRAGAGRAAPSPNDLVIAAQDAEDYRALFEELRARDLRPRHLVHAWALDGASGEEEARSKIFDSLLRIAQELARDSDPVSTHLSVLGQGLYRVFGEGSTDPLQAVALGAVRVIPKEIAPLSSRHLDLETGTFEDPDPALVDRLLAEALDVRGPESLALHHGRRWCEAVEPLLAPKRFEAPWREGQTWIVVGGLQTFGLEFARYLVSEVGARVALLDRTFFPHREEWSSWLEDESNDARISAAIRRLEDLGDGVQVLTANPENAERMRHAAAEVAEALGPVSGLLYLVKDGTTGLIQSKASENPSAVLGGLLREAEALGELLGSGVLPELQSTVLFGSNPTESGGLGQAEQSAAHAVLDHLGEGLGGAGRVLSVAWGTRGWEEEGSAEGMSFIEQQLVEKRRRFGTLPEEGFETLTRALALASSRLTVSTRDYDALLDQQHLFTSEFFQNQMGSPGADGGEGGHARPDLSTAYEAPTNEIESMLVEEWQRFFGLEEIGIHDNFFELGGHSLLAVQVINRINELFATDLSMERFFDTPSIAALAVALDTGAPADDEEAEALAALLAEIEGLSDDEVLQALDEPGQDRFAATGEKP